ncbi:MAG TPA: protein kinase [Candidatus Acidoferrales bacterium]|nr:protein kinase [Candidatus Acidoferrales bacterium]
MTEAWKQWEGQVVDGKFHLRQYLGGTDDSAVFLTEHGGPEPQKAAIKLIPARSQNAEFQLSRWEIAAHLSHPHLLRLFEMGRCRLGDAAMLYVVMEYAEENLGQIIPNRSLTAAEAQEMLKPVLEALAYLHAKGFVHGHLKPSNILAVDDQLRISSDRICAVGELRAGRSKPNVYAAPEIATRGQSPAGDTWSLGVTLVEVLTQKLPSWEWKGQEEPELPKNLPAPFGDIVKQCLKRDPQVRWKVADIAARLQLPLTVPEMPPTGAAPSSLAAKWRYVVSVAAGVLVLAAIFAGSKMFNKGSDAQAGPSVAAEPPALQPNPKPEAKKPEVKKPETQPIPKKLAAKPPEPVRAAPSPGAAPVKAATKKVLAGAVGGQVVHQVMPDVPQKARDTIRGTVRVGVRVQVDSSGSVVGETLDAPGPSTYFAKLAMNAAKGWKFTPATAGGENVASEWVVRFEFAQDDTRAKAVHAAP